MIKYTLQPYQGMQSRYRCPQCNHRSKSFVRYIDTQTGKQLAPYAGRCGREDKCGYHFKPADYFKQQGTYPLATGRIHKPCHSPALKPAQPPQTQYYISPDYVNNSFTGYHKNNFAQYLIGRFGYDVAEAMVGRYRIGSHSHWPGATVFWQLDAQGYVRTGKIMLYDKATGKRVKQPFNHITWAHTLLVGKNPTHEPLTINHGQKFILNQCLFGEHLLAAHPYKPVAIVESEKTAIIASVMIPQFVWLASGSLNGLNPAKCRVLQGRQVMLFPDVNAYDKWLLKATQLQIAMPGTTVLVSNVLERTATTADRANGADIGDVVGW